MSIICVNGFRYTKFSYFPSISFFHIIGVKRVLAETMLDAKGLKSLNLVHKKIAIKDKFKRLKSKIIVPKINKNKFNN